MSVSQKINYSRTLYLPKTEFPMRANLPTRELELISRWEEMKLSEQIRKSSTDRKKFILHDGPPYANGHIHIGHALNKILKDVIVRSFQMRGFDANYLPGWDCHGLPIEWKVEEEYRKQGKNKDEIPVNEFRQECRKFAAEWVKIQSTEFKRLGIEGNFEAPYTTMTKYAESQIAAELLKLITTNQIYRSSKPIMWSVVECTALSEAEIEYYEMESDTVWIEFPIKQGPSHLLGANIVIWTTTPWTIPGNRAIAFSSNYEYGLYKIISSENTFGNKQDRKIILSKQLAEQTALKAKIVLEFIDNIKSEELSTTTCSHPLKDLGYVFSVPLLDTNYVNNEIGTGFVHMAPSHGVEDFDAWILAKNELQSRDINTHIPYPVDEKGFYTKDAPGFSDSCVITETGEKGDANERIISALIVANNLLIRSSVKHSYPHSWRSKKPLIFRNTSQWFISMDKDLGDSTTLRTRALNALDSIRFFPFSGQNRLRTMIENRPDWVLSRQRVWGVPICLFFNESGEILLDNEVNSRIIEAFKTEGSDSWFDKNARKRFLGKRVDEPWIQSQDILDVWFDSGSTHSFVLQECHNLQWPADVFLEGSDQHRGWFQHSLLESCATRNLSPFKTLITHGFTVDKKGEKMSKSKGNVISPDEIINQSGADILRLWVMTSDYTEDQRIGEMIVRTNIDAYRKLRNTLRWMVGMLTHYTGNNIAPSDMPELEQLILHRLTELDTLVREGYDNFNFKRVIRTLIDFSNIELSAFYFDIRKDALYCDSPSSIRRQSSLIVIKHLCTCLVTWLAPMLPFTMEEVWLYLNSDTSSVHLEQFPKIPKEWNNVQLAEKWQKIREVRKVVTGALEVERKEKRIGSSLEAAPIVYITDPEFLSALKGQDLAEICITSSISIINDKAPENCFQLSEIPQIGVQSRLALGKKCARSWRITQDVGSDLTYPDVSARDAAALHELNYLEPQSFIP
ncbi:Isoleucyl-tRNA synthetase [Liberibacter crescens BT-1]|uniref:Isoleucine--tRNA ligase n=1 Tax=Liberibacter crescens (strain BT-1) TaxID=1215343 RepID=L0ET46_LIBCB|nr:isoleucine--tRNA ligase [Liberibacter crescens]AGA64117.1 Isoleucyl-tRNA synthetase [Liberibacter crescens BT-1]AMC12396.1 isoleucine--tRNA ligase [Liberibacter crescens]